jgi:pyruvate/2-oxoglutarate dehydrogenase complex dihydrolipoamide dehydrogenase (E3) component
MKYDVIVIGAGLGGPDCRREAGKKEKMFL